MAEKATVTVHEAFEVQASQDQVWHALEDVGLIAACMPNATLAPSGQPGEYTGTIAVKLGPLKAEFKGSVTIDRSESERKGKVAAKAIDKLGSRVSSSMEYVVGDREGGAAGTRVTIHGSIEVSGSLAKFATTGGQVLARSVTREFASRLEEKLNAIV